MLHVCNYLLFLDFSYMLCFSCTTQGGKKLIHPYIKIEKETIQYLLHR